MKKEVNAIGDICPIPLVKAKEAIKELNGAGVVAVSYTHLTLPTTS